MSPKKIKLICLIISSNSNSKSDKISLQSTNVGIKEIKIIITIKSIILKIKYNENISNYN